MQRGYFLLKEADLLAIRNFIATKKPHVIVISGESREATMVAADIKECVTTLVEEEQFPSIQVEICDNELAKIYSNSNKGIVSINSISLMKYLIIEIPVKQFMANFSVRIPRLSGTT